MIRIAWNCIFRSNVGNKIMFKFLYTFLKFLCNFRNRKSWLAYWDSNEVDTLVRSEHKPVYLNSKFLGTGMTLCRWGGVNSGKAYKVFKGYKVFIAIPIPILYHIQCQCLIGPSEVSATSGANLGRPLF